MRRLKAAVIGSGFIGATHVETLKRVPGVDVMALVDIVDPVQKAEKLDVPNEFPDYREMIEAIEPGCVHICIPNHTHEEIALYVFKHGVHIVCEEPVARNAGGTKEMLEAARKSNLVHAVNLHNRFCPTNHRLCNTILDGALDKVYGVYRACLRGYFSQRSDFNWCMLPAKGGSTHVTLDIGPYWIDLVEHITGNKVKEVFAEFQTNLPVRKMSLVGNLKDVMMDTEGTSYVMVRFEGEAVGNAVFSQVYRDGKNQTTIRISDSGISAEWNSEAIGDLKLGYRNEPNRLLTKDRGLAHPGTAPITTCPDGYAEGLPGTFKRNFIAVYGAVRGVRPVNPYADFEDGLHQMQVLDKMLESAKTGCWTSVS